MGAGGGLAALLVALHVAAVVANSRVAIRKLTLGMTEADVVASLGQPTQAYDWHTADHAVTGRKLSYDFPFLWDRLLTKLPGRWRYYNPAWVTVEFLQGSPTVTEILRHNAYQNGAIVVERVDQSGAANKVLENIGTNAPNSQH